MWLCESLGAPHVRMYGSESSRQCNSRLQMHLLQRTARTLRGQGIAVLVTDLIVACALAYCGIWSLEPYKYGRERFTSSWWRRQEDRQEGC